MNDQRDTLERYKKKCTTKDLHHIMTSYKEGAKIIYGFCEGKDDLSFYRGVMENCFDSNNCDWLVQLEQVGGVDNVLTLYEKFERRQYKKEQVVFFMDRDLTEFTGVKRPNRENIYITDNYSIENDLVNSNTCERLLVDLLGFDRLNFEELKEVRTFFDNELEKFMYEMVPIMSWIVYCFRKKQKPLLNEIEMKSLFRIKKGTLDKLSNIKEHQDLVEYMHKQCKVDIEISRDYDHQKGHAEFYEEDRHKKFIRGKYLIWFLSNFCTSIKNDYSAMSFTFKNKKIAKRNLFSQSNATASISSRSRPPRSLTNFIENTVKQYVSQVNSHDVKNPLII